MKKNRRIKKNVIYTGIIIILLIVSISSLIINYLINNEEKILWGKSTSNFDVNFILTNT